LTEFQAEVNTASTVKEMTDKQKMRECKPLRAEVRPVGEEHQ